MSAPLVSIIVTSYNHAEYLKQRMDTLFAQTYENREIIVIDDCSTDDSVQVLSEYSDYPDITIVALDKNGGYAKACNLGVEMSRGEYIMFAECDDYNHPSHIEVLMNKMLEFKTAGVVFCRSNIVDSKGKLLGNDFEDREKVFKKLCSMNTLISQKKIQRFFLTSCVIPNMSATLIKKDCILKINGFSSDFKVCADWDFWCRLAENNDFYYISDSLNNFRTHPTTARNLFGIDIHVQEYFKLLYSSLSKIDLNYFEKFKYRAHYGRLWANFITISPRKWLSSFRYLVKSVKVYENHNILFLFIGMTIMISSIIWKKLNSLKN